MKSWDDSFPKMKTESKKRLLVLGSLGVVSVISLCCIQLTVNGNIFNNMKLGVNFKYENKESRNSISLNKNVPSFKENKSFTTSDVPDWTNFNFSCSEVLAESNRTKSSEKSTSTTLMDNNSDENLMQQQSDNLKLKQKLIYGATETYGTWEERFNFTNCPYSNCVVRSGHSAKLEDADIVLFGNEFIKHHPPAISKNRNKQIWILNTFESPRGAAGAYKFSSRVNGYFNASYTYRTDSELYSPYGWAFQKHDTANDSKSINYAHGKTKGAYAYVSNCDKSNYDRIGFMNELKKYIDVDIFGKCTKSFPCPRMEVECEGHAHSQYRFYLSYENSLCKDYITEKFWARMQSPAIFLPVALGGMSISEYSSVAPPDSFLHYYNFTSTEGLGRHLQHLMKNDEAYNRYHQWRAHYEISRRGDKKLSCSLCEMANRMPSVPANEHLAEWFNNPKLCRSVNL